MCLFIPDYNRIRSEWGTYQRLSPNRRSQFLERVLPTFQNAREAHWWSLFFAADPVAAQRFRHQSHQLRLRVGESYSSRELADLYQEARRQDWLSGTTLYPTAPLWEPFVEKRLPGEHPLSGWSCPEPLQQPDEKAWSLRVPVLDSLPLADWPPACQTRLTRIWQLSGGWYLPVNPRVFARPLSIVWEPEALTFILGLPGNQAPEPYLSAGLAWNLLYHWPGLGVDPCCLTATRLITVRLILEPRAWLLREASSFSFPEFDLF